jgi:hypothetical protein
MVSGDASGKRHRQSGPGTIPRGGGHNLDPANASLGYGVSWFDLLRMGIGIKFADQSITIVFGGGSELGDEGFDEVPAGFLECFGPAEVRGIGFDEGGIKVVLAD